MLFYKKHVCKKHEAKIGQKLRSTVETNVFIYLEVYIEIYLLIYLVFIYLL